MNIFEIIKTKDNTGECRLFTLINTEAAGSKLLLDEEGRLLGSSPETEALKAEELAELSEDGCFELGGRRVFAETLRQRPTMVICGAGHVSLALIRLGKMTGFKTVCIDDREEFAENARGAGADQVLCGAFEEELDSIQGDRDTYFIIVTRSHSHDYECLMSIERKSSAYVGMMGSSRRIGIVKSNLAQKGLREEFLSSLHAPIGLAIGAETPEEIAVSIMAQIIELKNKRSRNSVLSPEILERLAAGTSEDRVLAVVVSKQGSAPRNTGSRMLIFPDASFIGTVGGGIVEAEVLSVAREILEGRGSKTRLIRVSLTDRGEILSGEEGEKAVCGGEVEIFLERV